ncbi:MAG TPA: SAM-dependent methyltransferase, partial [Actinomycetota bacterium]
KAPDREMMRPLLEEVHERIHAGGPLPYDAFMRLVLYHPDGGYYATRVPGSGGDYGTSPSLTPWFGRLVKRELSAMWDAVGRPDPFTVVEVGAGRADLAAAVLESAGHFRGALRWRFVERFGEIADLQRGRLGALAASAEWSEQLGPGPHAPAGSGCVLAHEVLDNFPVHVLEVTPSGDVHEVYVGEEHGRLIEHLGPLSDPALRSAAEAAQATLSPGHRLEVNLDLDGWMGEAAAAVARGYLLIVDYGDVEPDLWLRNPGGTMVTYGTDGFREEPLADPGLRDVTAEVHFSAVDRAARRHGFEPQLYCSQRDWLASLGHGALAEGLERAADRAAADGRHTDAMAIEADLSELRCLVGHMGYGDIRVFRAAKAAPVPVVTR